MGLAAQKRIKLGLASGQILSNGLQRKVEGAGQGLKAARKLGLGGPLQGCARQRVKAGQIGKAGADLSRDRQTVGKAADPRISDAGVIVLPRQGQRWDRQAGGVGGVTHHRIARQNRTQSAGKGRIGGLQTFGVKAEVCVKLARYDAPRTRQDQRRQAQIIPI